MTENKKTLKLKVWKTNKGLVVYSTEHIMGYYHADGVKLEDTHSHKYYLVTNADNIVKLELRSTNTTLQHYKLKDVNNKSNNFPLIIEFKDIEYCEEDYHNRRWIGKHEGKDNLYKEVYKSEEVVKNIDFELEFCGSGFVGDLDTPSYRVDMGYGRGGKSNTKLRNMLTYDPITKALVPEVFYDGEPCELSAKYSLAIVREYVKEHIDNKIAYISSDYDFSFNVDKKIKIKPYQKKYTNLKGRVTSTKLTDHKLVTIYKIATERKDGYGSIIRFRGDNLEDIRIKIDDYLKKLIDFINEPVVECSTCNGIGAIVEEYKED